MPIKQLRYVYAHSESLTITMPKTWTKAYGVRKGDHVIVYNYNGVLIITPHHRPLKFIEDEINDIRQYFQENIKKLNRP